MKFKMKVGECFKACFLGIRDDSPKEELEKARKVRKKAEENVKQTKATLNGEEGWFLSLQKWPPNVPREDKND